MKLQTHQDTKMRTGTIHTTDTVKKSISDFDAYPSGYSDWVNMLSCSGINATRQGNTVFLNGGKYRNEGYTQLPSNYKYQ